MQLRISTMCARFAGMHKVNLTVSPHERETKVQKTLHLQLSIDEAVCYVSRQCRLVGIHVTLDDYRGPAPVFVLNTTQHFS